MQVDTVIDQLGRATVMHYDSVFGNLASMTKPDSLVSSTTYDRYGRDSTSAGPGHATTTTLYDLANRPISASDGVNPTPTTFTYDPMGRFSIVTDPQGQSYRTEYDTLGRVTRRYDATGSGKFNSYRYDIAGRATSTTNRRGQRVDVTYDSLGRMLTRTDVASGAVDSYTYSADGLTSGSANANAGDTTIVDVASGSVSTTTHENGVEYINGQTLSPSFNIPDTVIVTAPTFGGTPSRRIMARDPVLGALGAVSLGGHTTTFGYNDQMGTRTSTVYVPPVYGDGGNVRTDSYTPLTGRLTEMSFSAPRVDSVLHRAYGYDAAGRITSEQVAISAYEGTDGATERQRQFTYDSLGRLTSVTVRRGTCMPWPSDSTAPDSLSASLGWRYTCGAVQKDSGTTYTYDAVGNRTDHGAIVTTGNRLVKFNGDTITYDDDGNMTGRYDPATGAGRQYVWNALGQLDSTIVLSAPDPVTGVQTRGVERYLYDASGRLVHMDHGESGGADRNWIVYNGDHVSELVQSPTSYTDVAYDDGTDRPAMEYVHRAPADEWHAQLMDPMGNVAGAVSMDSVGIGYTWDAWGRNTSTTWDGTEVLGWKGLETETDAGLIYVRARWYDPALGRFISEDPVGLSGGINQYVFAGDDPINNSDPSGALATEMSYEDIAQILAAAVAAAAGRDGGLRITDDGVVFGDGTTCTGCRQITAAEGQQLANNAVALAMSYRLAKTPYVPGGTSISGADCTGFCKAVFDISGLANIPYTQSSTFDDSPYFVEIPVNAARAGDILWQPRDGMGNGHVGIYEGLTTKRGGLIGVEMGNHGASTTSIWGPQTSGGWFSGGKQLKIYRPLVRNR